MSPIVLAKENRRYIFILKWQFENNNNNKTKKTKNKKKKKKKKKQQKNNNWISLSEIALSWKSFYDSRLKGI